MKKVLPSVVISMIMMILSCISSQAMTNAEKDIYNHKYYPQSVYNGGVNQSPQQDTHDFYVNPSTGNATVNVTDLSLAGKNGFNLNITRIYNSMSSNLYEPYIAEIENYTPTQFYIVSGKKDFEKIYTDDRPMDFGYNNSVFINRNYYNQKFKN